MDKTRKQIIKSLRRQGWRIEEGTKHIKCFSPDGETIVTMGRTPSDHRAVRNLKARLRKGGWKDDV